MTIYTDTLKTGENVYMIASERSERADFFISALKTYASSQYIYIVDKSMFVGIYPCVRNTRDMVLFIIQTRKQENLWKPLNDIERAERASRNFCTLARKHILHNYTDQKLKIML